MRYLIYRGNWFELYEVQPSVINPFQMTTILIMARQFLDDDIVEALKKGEGINYL